MIIFNIILFLILQSLDAIALYLIDINEFTNKSKMFIFVIIKQVFNSLSII